MDCNLLEGGVRANKYYTLWSRNMPSQNHDGMEGCLNSTECFESVYKKLFDVISWEHLSRLASASRSSGSLLSSVGDAYLYRADSPEWVQCCGQRREHHCSVATDCCILGSVSDLALDDQDICNPSRDPTSPSLRQLQRNETTDMR